VLILYGLAYGASAACFSSGNGSAVLLDTGGKFSLEAEVAPSLLRLGMRPDSVIFTHEDAAHLAPIELLTELFPLRQIASYKANQSTIPTFCPKAGERLDFGGGAWAEVLLSPADRLLGSLADDKTLVLRVHWKGWKIVFQGDAGRLSEDALLASGVDLSADVLVLGQHESDLSVSPEWVSAIQPKLIIFPRNTGCETDAYRSSRISELQQQGHVVIDQAHSGGLRIRHKNSGHMSVRGFLDPSECLLSRGTK
jgi:competence protein ComEC